MNKNHHVVIMAGGIGSRFWPMSRSNRPKQFLDVLGTGKTLIQQTYERFLEIIPAENIWVVTNTQYTDLVREQLPNLTESNILPEPVGRNTAPCVAYAAFRIHQVNPKARMVVAASDHLIMNPDRFRKDILLALTATKTEDIIMTLGIQPSRPDTGYGYIQYLDSPETSGSGYHKVKTFTEKPTREIALSFIQSGDFLWNSGIFIFSVKTILKAFEKFMPELHELFVGIRKQLNTPEEAPAIKSVYDRCKNISIDNGIMELAENVFVIPGHFGWSDLGTWVSLYQEYQKDYLGNAVYGKGMIYNSSNNIIRVEKKDKLVLVEGLEKYIIVDTDNVLLICKMDSEQRIKEFVGDAKKEAGENFV
jgi:mannose-1-phosphate guanylyltransferase